MLVGTRVSSTLLATLVYDCGECGRVAVHLLAKRSRWLTVVFVPLVSVGASYLETCTVCAHARQLGWPARQLPASGLR